MKLYRIKSGAFRLDDETVRGVGDEIELPDDIARLHPEKLELVTPPAPAETAAAGPLVTPTTDAGQ